MFWLRTIPFLEAATAALQNAQLAVQQVTLAGKFSTFTLRFGNARQCQCQEVIECTAFELAACVSFIA